MQSAGIYKVEKKRKYLIYGLARIKMGASIPTEPYIWLDFDTPEQQIIENLRLALDQGNKVLPNPKSWEAQEKDFLDKIGLKSQKELYSGAKYVFVNQEKGVWTFSPSCNLGKQGITSMKGKSISVKDSNNFTDISESLQQAFELCQ